MQRTWEHSFGAVSQMADGRRARIRRWDAAGAPYLASVRHQLDTVFQASCGLAKVCRPRRQRTQAHTGMRVPCAKPATGSEWKARKGVQGGGTWAQSRSSIISSQGALLLGTQKGSEAPAGTFASQRIDVIQQTVDEATKRQWRTVQTDGDISWSRVFATAIAGRGAEAQGMGLPGPANAATRGTATP